MPEIEIQKEVQNNPVADEVSALIAVVRPILKGLLYSLKQEVVEEIGSPDKIKFSCCLAYTGQETEIAESAMNMQYMMRYAAEKQLFWSEFGTRSRSAKCQDPS